MPFSLNWLEIIGYSGSLLIAISLMMSSIKRLRWINIFGASSFAVYGLLVHAYPVFLLNSFITIVDFYYLFKIKRSKDFFELFYIDIPESPFLKRFLEFYKEDIEKYFPAYQFQFPKDGLIVFILRNLLPVGLFIAERVSKDTLEIKIDYVAPDYRDLKSAHFLYQQSRDDFKKLDIAKFIINSSVSAHTKYLKKIGFVADGKRGPGWYQKEI